MCDSHMSSVYTILYCHLHIMRFICVIFNIKCKMNKLIVVESTVDKQTQYNFLFIFYGDIRHSTIFSYFWSFHFLNLLNIGGVSHSINKTNANFLFLDLCKWRVPRWLEIACVRECFLVFIDTSDFLLRRFSLQNFSTRVLLFYSEEKCVEINWYFNNRSFNAWILLTVKVTYFKGGSISIT